MEAVGIITEYNPFHNGHLYQIKQIKSLFPEKCIVVVMSGNFLQRGEPACMDKWMRAKQALQNGVDLVIELPVTACVQPADRFAYNGIEILKALGVSKLVFGAEHANYDFKAFARQVDGVKGNFKKYDEAYAATFQQAVTAKIGYDVSKPNDLLGLAYAKANFDLGEAIELIPVQRIQANYHDQKLDSTQTIASASAIRKNYAQGNVQVLKSYVPEITFNDVIQNKLVDWDDFWPLLRYKILTTSPKHLQYIYGMAEGIEYRLQQQLEQLPVTASFDEWMHTVKTKRFTYTRLARLAITILLNLKQNDINTWNNSPYIRLLGFTSRGQKYLNQVKKDPVFPIITKVSKKSKNTILKADYRAGKVYQLITGEEQDLKKAPIRNFK